MMDCLIKRFVCGPIETNTYVVYTEQNKYCLVIDPSSNCGETLDFISNRDLDVSAILLTHGHFDHILGIPEISARFPKADVYAHPDEFLLISNEKFNGSTMLGSGFAYTGRLKELREGDAAAGEFTFKVLHVPGHSPGGIALIFGKNCISGDAIFAGSIGRTDFPGGDSGLFMKNLREKLLVLPDDTVVWPGHGGRTTIGREKKYNPYFI
jgi:glyoxylase-like metal-dependent hydrolase (beta-lactamase superfamily II)